MLADVRGQDTTACNVVGEESELDRKILAPKDHDDGGDEWYYEGNHCTIAMSVAVPIDDRFGGAGHEPSPGDKIHSHWHNWQSEQ